MLMCRFFNWYPVGFLNQMADTWILLVKVPESEMTREFLSQLAKDFESNLTQNESSVSMEGHFLLDGDLAQVETVGTRAVRMKTSESSGPGFD